MFSILTTTKSFSHKISFPALFAFSLSCCAPRNHHQEASAKTITVVSLSDLFQPLLLQVSPGVFHFNHDKTPFHIKSVFLLCLPTRSVVSHQGLTMIKIAVVVERNFHRNVEIIKPFSIPVLINGNADSSGS